MKLLKTIFLPASFFTLFFTQILLSQAQTAPPVVAPTPTPLTAEMLAQNLEKAKRTGVSGENRRQAYAKLLEGQRFLLDSARLRSQTAIASSTHFARQSFQKAVELDPLLAEGYTALAELGQTIDESLMLAQVAVKADPNNYGAHRILSRIYIIKSGLATGKLIPELSDKAVNELNQLTTLDPRNAETWAFLGEFYERNGKADEQINALRRWQSAAAPLETQFFGRITGEELSPETASLKLAAVLIKKGNIREALENISLVIENSPDNPQAVELLRQAVESGDGATAATAVQSLQQAVFSNPSNVSLIELLAEVQSRAGKTDEAAKLLIDASARLLDADKISAANLQVSLGDLYAEKDRTDEAIKAYEQGLSLRGVIENQPVTDDDRDFVTNVFEKMIQSYKKANRPNDVKAVIEKARTILGKNDLFADSQIISFYRETGKKDEALRILRELRAKNPDSYAMLRLEAQILTDGGKVDQAVALVKPLLKKNQVLLNGGDASKQSAPVSYDDFVNYLFISSLYTQANRGKEAIDAANQALTIADGDERRQMAQLTLASAQEMAGDFKSAEETLRFILKKTPDNATALNNLGYFLLERDQRIDEALNLIQQAVTIEPSNPSFLDSLGWAYFKKGKFSEAAVYLSKAARLDTTSSTIQEHLGDVYQKLGKPDSAKSAWQNALKLTEDAKDVSRIKAKIK